ncbi:MAG: aldehyde dehydrogenase family protein, partial [Bacteroidota bacterium]
MIELIKNKQLIQNQLFINNEWLDAESGNTFRVKNPFDQSELTEVSDGGPADTQAAIEAASNALGLWKILTAGERSAILRKWFNLIIKNQEDLATLLTLEQGKPLM